jgi:hypothetical protein
MEGRFISAHSFIEFSLWLLGSMFVSSPHVGQEAENKIGTKEWEPGIAFNGLTLVTYYLKLGPPPTDLQPPKNSATSWR